MISEHIQKSSKVPRPSGGHSLQIRRCRLRPDLYVSFLVEFQLFLDDFYSRNFPILLIVTDFKSENRGVSDPSNKFGFKLIALFFISKFLAIYF